MKKNALFLLLAILTIVAIWIYFKCCNSPGTSPIVEIKSRIVSPIAVSFIELNSPTPKNIDQKIKVTFVDPKGMVLSSNGIPLQTIDISSVMSIGLSPQAVFSADDPYVFYIKAESEGYSTDIRPVVVTENVPQYIPFRMVRLTDMEQTAGLSSALGTFSDISGEVLQTSQTINVGTPSNPLRMTFPEGLQFLRAGKPAKVEGNLAYTLLRGDALDSLANLVFPGGFNIVNAVDRNGKNIATPTTPGYFFTAGWFAMSIRDSGGRRFDSFSKPVQVEMPINSKIHNPTTNATVKAGDQVPVWSMDENYGIWVKEGNATIVDAGGGNLVTTFEITHLSYWNLDFFDPSCTGDIVVSYSNASFPLGNYGVRYVRESDGAVLQETILPLGNTPMTLIRAIGGGRLYVREGPDVEARLLGRTDELLCPGAGTLGTFGNPQFPCVEFEFKRRLPDNTEENLCNMSVWYKEGTCGGASGYLYHAGSRTAAETLRVFSAGNVTECVQLRFVNDDAQEVIIPFGISYAEKGNGIQANIAGLASVGGVSISFNFDYEVTNGASCDTRVQIVLLPSTIGGLSTCL